MIELYALSRKSIFSRLIRITPLIIILFLQISTKHKKFLQCKNHPRGTTKLSTQKAGVIIKHCIYCDRKVNPAKKINWFILILLLLITDFTYSFIYVPYYILVKRKHCPICNGTDFKYFE